MLDFWVQAFSLTSGTTAGQNMCSALDANGKHTEDVYLKKTKKTALSFI